MNSNLTILTDPIPCGRYFFTEIAKSLGRPVKNFLRPLPPFIKDQKYRGHFAVTRSLVEGLKKIGANFNYNPKRLKDVGEVVVVLSGVGTLRQAIQWKNQGRIRKLLAGPNILVWPSEHPEIAAPEVDVCITNSDWTNEGYQLDLPALKGRCRPWPAGVDIERWKPKKPRQERNRFILFFEKHSTGEIPEVHPFVEVAERYGYRTHVLKYGAFMPQDYSDMLSESRLMVGFVRGESQGIAWTEAWATDVPTLLWRNEENVIRGKITRVSTAPYLSNENGRFFDNPADLKRLLKDISEDKIQFSPRRWVLENMSDEVCARDLLHIAARS